ncbi:MAG TPA: Sua5/YciO/YrdC/YwlC family protein, partial [Gammaproteobacteria bacterium]
HVVEQLRRGAIVAIKGLGGFHLACQATRPDAVATLRRRKGREEKPFAVMVANPASLAGLAVVEPAAAALLQAPERPIVLLPKAPGADAALPGVAPGMRWLGALLPYTPLHWLLFHAAAGQPAGHAWCAEAQPLVLVLTSANPGGEPLVIDDDEAVARLGGIADRLLLHDRPIRVRCDDSVVRVHAGAPAFVRRARGHVPQAIRLPAAGPSVLALGGALKNAVCVTRGDRAFLSAHVGDLDHPATCRALDASVAHLLEVLEIAPAVVARDLHPDFYSSRFAERFAAARGLPCHAVQHHHAHVAAVVAEQRLDGEVLGLALDGVGLGDDGHAWGGELLRVGPRRWQRLAHLRPLALPGGDVAAREPWRMAAAALHAGGRGATDAGAGQPLPAEQRRRAAVRRGRRAARGAAAGQLRGAGGDALRGTGRRRLAGRPAARRLRHQRTGRTRPAAGAAGAGRR